MSLPKITVITPSYNQGKYLEETILSVLEQGYPNLEYMVIDGNSSDNSTEIIRKYENKITYWISEKDNGQSHAINKGLARATGEIIAWLNSDDLYVAGALFKVAECFKKYPEAALIHGKTILFGNKKRELVKGAENFDLELRYFSVIPFAQPSSFFRRKVVEEQGMLNEKLHFGMDYDLLVRIALNYKIEKSEETFSKYRMHSGSKTISSQLDFTHDWANVFSKFLRTADTEKKWIPLLSDMDMYVTGDDQYKSSRKFRADELKIIFLYFLEYQLHTYYELLDTKQVEKICSLISAIDDSFYKKRGLNRIHWRVSKLNPVAIKLFRKMSRR